MKPQMDERWRRKGASTVEYIVVLAAVFILAMAVYHALSGDEMAGMIMEKIQA
ncbi:general secretion pathway protein I, partial [Desmospora sp. 8437]